MTLLRMAIACCISGLCAAAPAPTFRIHSPSQTSRSVLLAWETDQKVRTQKTAHWGTSTPTGATHKASIAPGEGRAGTTAAKITGATSDNNARGCFILNMEDLRERGTYDYAFFYRATNQKKGCARAVMDCYVGDQRKYHGLVRKDLPASEAWREVAGSFDLPDDVRLTRILLYQAGQGTAWFDDVRLAKRGAPDNLVADSCFDGTSSCRVLFRAGGQDAWQRTDAVVRERFHNVIFLKPETRYEFKVQRVSPSGEAMAESQVLPAATQPVRERVWEGLHLGLDQHTPTPASVYPCIESVDGKLCYSECRAGAIWLTELDDDLGPRWTKQWVKPFRVEGRSCYQGQAQTAALGHKLYVSWKRAHHGDAPHARQCVASYDTATGEVGDPFVIEPDDPTQSTWNGGIAALDGKLWVSYCRWQPRAQRYKTTVTLRQLDYDARKLGPPFEMSPQPTETPYTPFLSVFNQELVVCFTDSQAKTDMQPLYLVRFDGQQFHDLMVVSPTGFNQYAKGVQCGDKLLLVWKYGAPYPSRIYGRYMFHDIGLALVDPIAKTARLTSLVDDIKYNSSPDITHHRGRFVYVYNKFEHLYGGRADPGKLYGSFIGALAASSH